MIYKTTYNSPFGQMLLASDEDNNLLGVWFFNQKYFASTLNLKEEIIQKDDLEIFKKTKNWLSAYFNHQKPDISKLSLKPMGSEFQKSVRKILSKIPYGKVTTYGKIAKEIAILKGKDKMSAQAVGNAVGCNPFSIIIPCHRVIGSNGAMIGYAGGVDIKKKLLEFEKADI